MTFDYNVVNLSTKIVKSLYIIERVKFANDSDSIEFKQYLEITKC